MTTENIIVAVIMGLCLVGMALTLNDNKDVIEKNQCLLADAMCKIK